MRTSSIQSVLESTPQLRYVIHRARSPHLRSFSSTPALSVRRPMEKYEYEKPYRDEWGHTHQQPPKRDPQFATDEFLRNLAEGRQRTWTEKYGAHDGFGMKNRKRFIKGLDGQLIPWDAASKDWRLATGYYNRSRAGIWQARVPGTMPPRGDALPLAFFKPRPPRVPKGQEEVEENVAQKEWREAQEGEYKVATEATPRIETPSDIIQLNLDAWEANYKAAADSGMFVKRKSMQQIKRERKFLKKKMELEAKRAMEEGVVPQEEDAEPTVWEVDQDLDQEKLDEISALPPSERRKLDPRIEGRGGDVDSPVRSRWAERGAAAVSVDVRDSAEPSSAPAESSDAPGPETPERFFGKPVEGRPSVESSEPLGARRGRSGGRFGTQPPRSSFGLGRDRHIANTRDGPQARYYSTAAPRAAQDVTEEYESDWIEETVQRPNRAPRDVQKTEERRAQAHAYREQVAAMFVPNRRRRYQETLETLETQREPTEPKKRWEPTKKLTYPAMEGLRALHRADPATFNSQALSHKFGISREATHRILRSRWRDKAARPKADSVLEGTKWAKKPSTAGIIERVYAQRQDLVRAAEASKV